MKNIIDLYEASILGDIEDNLDFGDNYAEMYKWFEAMKNIDDFPKVVNDLIKDIKNNGGKKVTKDIEHGNYYLKITHYVHKIESYNLRFYWPKPEQPLEWKYCDVFRKKVDPEYEYLLNDLDASKNRYQNLVYFSHKDKFNTSPRASLRPARYKKPDSEELYLLPEKYKKLIEILKKEGEKHNNTVK